MVMEAPNKKVCARAREREREREMVTPNGPRSCVVARELQSPPQGYVSIGVMIATIQPEPVGMSKVSVLFVIACRLSNRRKHNTEREERERERSKTENRTRE